MLISTNLFIDISIVDIALKAKMGHKLILVMIRLDLNWLLVSLPKSGKDGMRVVPLYKGHCTTPLDAPAYHSFPST